MQNSPFRAHQGSYSGNMYPQYGNNGYQTQSIQPPQQRATQFNNFSGNNSSMQFVPNQMYSGNFYPPNPAPGNKKKAKKNNFFNFKKENTALYKKEAQKKTEKTNQKLMIIEGVDEGTADLKNELIELTSKLISENVPKIIGKFLPQLIQEKVKPVLTNFSNIFTQNRQNLNVQEMINLNLQKLQRDINSTLVASVDNCLTDYKNIRGTYEIQIRKKWQKIIENEKLKFQMEIKAQEKEFQNMVLDVQDESIRQIQRIVQKLRLEIKAKEQRWIDKNNDALKLWMMNEKENYQSGQMEEEVYSPNDHCGQKVYFKLDAIDQDGDELIQKATKKIKQKVKDVELRLNKTKENEGFLGKFDSSADSQVTKIEQKYDFGCFKSAKREPKRV